MNIVTIADYVLFKPVNEELKDKNGMIITDKSDFRYSKGKIVSVGESCGKLKVNDVIYYDKSRTFSLHIDGENVMAIKYTFIVCAVPS